MHMANVYALCRAPCALCHLNLGPHDDLPNNLNKRDELHKVKTHNRRF